METTNRINDVIKKLYPKDFHAVKRKRSILFKLKDNKLVVIVTLCVFLIPVLISVFYYNRFVSLHTDAITAKAQVRTYLQKRGNIVINLTKMVIDYAEHERSMYKYTADIRKEIMPQTNMFLNAANGINMANMAGKEFSNLKSLLSKFMAWSENYPDLKLNENFQDFMREIVAVETNIADARVVYNNKVNIYTTYRTKFPNYIFAWVFRFSSMEFYKGSKEFQKFHEVKY